MVLATISVLDHSTFDKHDSYTNVNHNFRIQGAVQTHYTGHTKISENIKTLIGYFYKNKSIYHDN